MIRTFNWLTFKINGSLIILALNFKNRSNLIIMDRWFEDGLNDFEHLVVERGHGSKVILMED